MALNAGRSIGRLNIRVIPDARKFRERLKAQILKETRGLNATVTIDKANVDRHKVREDIRRQMALMKDIAFDAKAHVVVDKVKLRKSQLRKAIQEEFDKFDDIRVRIHAEVANKQMFEREVKHMVNKASRNEVKLDVNAITAGATAHIKYVARPRIVTLLVRVSKKSVASALTALAALSGARLSWKWIDSLLDKMKELDRNLPRITAWTSGITALVAAVAAATSGVVGVGQGLFSILPAFLVLPGLILNAGASITSLIVALRNAGDELSPLKDDMSELSDIINVGFWDRARQPIIDLVQNLMPQLRRAFKDVSEGIGDFTAGMAAAFGDELSGGRLESIFKGIADGWRVLASGAPAFAGAMVSLSQIAATYTPRLARWFVRQADTFDKWLEAIATDGRLGQWMEDAIDSMYDVWDAVRGISGVFEGLWSAAEAAGSGGLKGFAQLMLTWERTVKSADFQRGLEAVFRGSGVAMTAFGDAIRGIGRLVSDLDRQFERFIGSAGGFLGGLIEGIADAMNQPAFGAGLMDFADGFDRAVERILPHLPKIAETFGGFLGLLGEMIATLLPTATAVLEALMPTVDSLISSIRDSGILETLGDALVEISQALAPVVKDLADALGPVVIGIIRDLVNILVDLTPVIVTLSEVLVQFVEAVGKWVEGNNDFFDGIRQAMGIDVDSEGAMKELNKLGNFRGKDDGKWWTIEPRIDFNRLWNDNRHSAEENARRIAVAFMDEYQNVVSTQGKEAADELVQSFKNIEGLPPEVEAKINESLRRGFAMKDLNVIDQKAVDIAVKAVADAFKEGGQDSARDVWNSWVMGIGSARNPMSPELREWVAQGLSDLGVELETSASGAGGGMAAGLTRGMLLGYPSIQSSVNGVKGVAELGLNGSQGWLVPRGHALMDGVRTGAERRRSSVGSVFSGVRSIVQAPLSGAGSWLVSSGEAIVSGLISGLNSMLGSLQEAAAGVMSTVRDFFPNSPAKVGPFSGDGWRAVLRSGAAVARQFTTGMGEEMARSTGDAMSALQFRPNLSGAANGRSPLSGGGGVNLTINNPVARDIQRDAWDAAQIAGVLV
ncbi:hypothetical protein [Microbacterium sp. YY-01]|uniref:hypothetical protein n=1 Tax=Microbacterium sp. YY-01 TaxID=3421634 RepID=UPI003D172B54